MEDPNDEKTNCRASCRAFCCRSSADECQRKKYDDGREGIVVCYTVNYEAIDAYKSMTGNTLKVGAFAVIKERLGANDVFDKNGNEASGVLNAEISTEKLVSFDFRIIGFTAQYADLELAMGVYVSVSDGEDVEFSYIQAGTPDENEKYCFITYGEVLNG